MRIEPMITDSVFQAIFPIIDGEFDLFELNDDLKIQLCESETANFYHDESYEEA